jgi:hypothetical protein
MKVLVARKNVNPIFMALTCLCTQIVRQHFGESAEEICDALIKRPRRSLKELQQDCQSIPVGQLRNGLLILIQHNLVSSNLLCVQAPDRRRSPLSE